MSEVVARAPGRINLIGEHTDHTGGLCFPMAIDRSVEIAGRARATPSEVRLTSDRDPTPAVVPLDVAHPRAVEPRWARYVAAIVAQLRPTVGFEGTVRSTLATGVGLSSSAALEVAVALALGASDESPVRLAQLCQAAEHAARGVPTGILDQLSSICGVAGHGLLIDCHALSVTPVPLPPDDEAEWVVLRPPAGRSLERSGYADRVRELAAAERSIGPLRNATLDAVAGLDDPAIRARARHVVSENARVRAFGAALAAGDLAAAGALIGESHSSLSVDFDSSTATIDELCAQVSAMPGVFGARITGGGWGGCAIALARPGVLADFAGAEVVRPSAGATVTR